MSTGHEEQMKPPPLSRENVAGICLIAAGLLLTVGHFFTDTVWRVERGVSNWGEDKVPRFTSGFPYDLYIKESLLSAVVLLLVAAGAHLCAGHPIQRHLRFLGVGVGNSPRLQTWIAAMGAAFLVFAASKVLSRLLSGTSMLAASTDLTTIDEAVLIGARAGLLEESQDLVLLIGVPLVIASSLGIRKRPIGWAAIVVVAVSTSAAVRGLQHIYQADYRLWAASGLGIGCAVVFLRWKMVWPVIIAHGLSNLWTATVPNVSDIVFPVSAAVVCGSLWLWNRDSTSSQDDGDIPEHYPQKLPRVSRPR